jgi:hypothetical protein
VYGADIARFGEDETCFATRQGDLIIKVERIGKQDTMTTANMLVAKLQHTQSTASVDVIGVGAGVVDRLRELNQSVNAFNASAKTTMTDATGEFTFNNVRSAAWWNLRELLDPARGATLALPPDDNLKTDLTTPRWRPAAGAKLIVEPKEDIVKRLGRSPDTGDAVVIACWEREGFDPQGAATVVRWDDNWTSNLAVAWGGGK